MQETRQALRRPLRRAPALARGRGVPFMLRFRTSRRSTGSGASAAVSGGLSTTSSCFRDKMGCVIDPFGHKWNIATHTRDLSPAEIQKGQKAWFEQMAHQEK